MIDIIYKSGINRAGQARSQRQRSGALQSGAARGAGRVEREAQTNDETGLLDEQREQAELEAVCALIELAVRRTHALVRAAQVAPTRWGNSACT